MNTTQSTDIPTLEAVVKALEMLFDKKNSAAIACSMAQTGEDSYSVEAHTRAVSEFSGVASALTLVLSMLDAAKLGAA